jgi:hypothetical protein
MRKSRGTIVNSVGYTLKLAAAVAELFSNDGHSGDVIEEV